MFSSIDGDDGPGGYQGNTPPFGYDRSRRSVRREAGNGNGRSGGYPYPHPQQNQSVPAGQAVPLGQVPPAGQSLPGQAQLGQAQLGPGPLGQTPVTQTPPHGVDYGGQSYYGPDDPGWGSGAREYGRSAVNGRDQGRPTHHQDGVPYPDGVPYQDGYPGPAPYDPRGFDRRLRRARLRYA